MSGHSKWATTKHKKAVVDAKRGKLFAKLIKNVEVAARTGGGDPAGNPTLFDAIQKAKKNSVPNDNIDRAIRRGSGQEAAVRERFVGRSLSAVTIGSDPGTPATEAVTDNFLKLALHGNEGLGVPANKMIFARITGLTEAGVCGTIGSTTPAGATVYALPAASSSSLSELHA